MVMEHLLSIPTQILIVGDAEVSSTNGGEGGGGRGGQETSEPQSASSNN